MCCISASFDNDFARDGKIRLTQGSRKQAHRVKFYIHLRSQKNQLLIISLFFSDDTKRLEMAGRIKGPIKEMTPIARWGPNWERRKFGGNSFHVSGMEIKIERVLMPEITVHLSRAPATRDIKGLFQMRRLSEKKFDSVVSSQLGIRFSTVFCTLIAVELEKSFGGSALALHRCTQAINVAIKYALRVKPWS